MPGRDDVIVGVHKADDNPFHAGFSPIPIRDAEIRICRKLPVEAGELLAACEEDADQMAYCLAHTLPIATMNRLLAKLLEMKAGDLRWPMKQKEGENERKEEKRIPKDVR